MKFLKPYLSRKFIATVIFGAIVPIAFKALGLSETVTLASMGLAAAYSASNALSKKSTE